MRHLGKQENLIVDSGPTFPPADNGELFIIDDPSNNITDGLYWYSERLGRWTLLVAIDELDAKVATKVDEKVTLSLSSEITTQISNTLPTHVQNKLDEVLPGSIDSALPAKIQEKLDIELPSAVDSRIAATPLIKASTEAGDITASKLISSSTVTLKEDGNGGIMFASEASLLELTMAESININTSSEVPIRWDSIITQSNIFDFTSGTSSIGINVHGLYDISYQVNAEHINGSTSANIKTYIKKNGTQNLSKSSNYSYMKKRDAENISNVGRCVVELDHGDSVQLFSKRKGKKAVWRSNI